MNKLLESILFEKNYTNTKGESIQIHSETSKQQCEFLQKIIIENNFKNSIEIGFAFGISTLAIIEEISKNQGIHTVIDKFQYSDWAGNGLDLINKAGYSERLIFYEKYCYQVLPELLEKKTTFDFAYLDSTKQFDWLLVDFFYLDKLLEIDGIIVFDDVVFPGIKKLMRLISQFPNYKVYSVYPENWKQTKSRKVDLLCKIFPFFKKFLREDYLKLDYELGINSHCVAMKKIDNDKRNWDWHITF